MSIDSIHPMVMKAARALAKSQGCSPALFPAFVEQYVEQAKATLTECGALECFEALKRLSGEWAYQCSKGNVPEGRVEAEMADKAIAKARDVSSDGVVYGSAP